MKAYLKRPKYRYIATICSVEVECTSCGKTQYIPNVPVEGLEKWLNGNDNIQDCLPKLNNDQRELLISGTCPKCWEEMWKEVNAFYDDKNNIQG